MCHKFMTHLFLFSILFIGIRGVYGTFLLHGLLTEIHGTRSSGRSDTPKAFWGAAKLHITNEGVSLAKSLLA